MMATLPSVRWKTSIQLSSRTTPVGPDDRGHLLSEQDAGLVWAELDYPIEVLVLAEAEPAVPDAGINGEVRLAVGPELADVCPPVLHGASIHRTTPHDVPAVQICREPLVTTRCERSVGSSAM